MQWPRAGLRASSSGIRIPVALTLVTRLFPSPGSPDALYLLLKETGVPLVAAYGSSKPWGRSGVEVCWFFRGAGCPALAARTARRKRSAGKPQRGLAGRPHHVALEPPHDGRSRLRGDYQEKPAVVKWTRSWPAPRTVRPGSCERDRCKRPGLDSSGGDVRREGTHGFWSGLAKVLPRAPLRHGEGSKDHLTSFGGLGRCSSMHSARLPTGPRPSCWCWQRPERPRCA